MSQRAIIDNHTNENFHKWKDVGIEGNELVCYEYQQDTSIPAVMIEGYQYLFSKKLLEVKRIGKNKLSELFKA